MLRRSIYCLGVVAFLSLAVAQGNGRESVRELELPGENVFPEGIAVAEDGRIFVGSSEDGTIYAGSPESEELSVLVEGGSEGSLDAAFGMTVDAMGRLWVAGGPTGTVGVFDGETGENIRTLEAPPAENGTFLNDLIEAPDGYVYITDSARPVLFRTQVSEEMAGELEAWLDLSESPIDYSTTGEGPQGTNLNGIVATDEGDHLITVDMNDGLLYRVALESGEVSEIDLGGESLSNADGLVIDGQTLFVVRLTENEVVTVDLADDYSSGTVTARFGDPALHWPATAALVDGRLYLVNTQFDRQEQGDADLPFTVATVPVDVVAQGGQPEEQMAEADGGQEEPQAAGEAEEPQAEGEEPAEEPRAEQEETAGEEDGEVAGGAAAQDAEEFEYSPVTDERLRDPEARNWLMWLGTYDAWSYSPLDQITPANVSDLRPVWTYSTGLSEGHEAPPIVNDGVMFVSTPENHVLAFEAATGDLLWRYERDLPHDLFQLHPTNRGVALYDDKVYLATLDTYLVALDARTGEVLWERGVEDYRDSYYMTLAPLVANGKVMVGVSGGELGVRGFVQAFDSETGDPAWKTYTIPAPGEPGNDTWPGNTWEHGGAPVWVTGSYDPELNLSYWGTGNAAPWTGDARPGDNLYSTSVVALDVDSGELVAHHQYHWNGSWDWDEVATPLLIDFERDGETVRGLMHAARSGYLWWLERSEDEIGFVEGKPYVNQNVFESLDPETGRPTYDEERKPAIDQQADFCPSLWGGKDWPPAAYNPETRLIYIPANENHCGRMTGIEEEYVAGQTYFGASSEFYIRDGADHIGELQAWNVDTGEQEWVHEFTDSHTWGPVMTTGGGLVFTGGTNDRFFRAFDAGTGEVLWQHRTNSGVNAVPVSFEVDGVQYIAVQSGWGVDAVRFQEATAADQGGQWNLSVPQGGVIWVFALDEIR
ncbi:MAG: PQQ-dependent dehydrogenase, methanol/ethanol family [Trueperaceae bacterium]